MNNIEKKHRLLIVDDEEEFLLSSSQAMSRRGFTVDVAPNGVTALEKVEENDYDAVVLDVKMPDIDGIEVFRQIHKSQPGLPIILLTGHSSIGDAFQTSKEGIADYLAKPIDLDELAKRVNQAISAARKRETGDEGKPPVIDSGDVVRIMIVDDEIELLDSLKKVLQRRKMDVITAPGGEEALRLLREKPIDVVVLDVKMPGMDGIEVLRRIKKEFPGVEVILLSGHPTVEAALEGVRLGAGEYLKKPPDIDELVGIIRRLYSDRQRAFLEQQQKLIDEIKRRYPE
jgi:DNA-binding NtrC family response regulator